MTIRQPRSEEKKEYQHQSSQAHIPVFWSLPYYYINRDHSIWQLLKFLHYEDLPKKTLWASFGPSYPKGPYTAHLRTLVPKTIPGMVFGTRVLKWAVHGPVATDPGFFPDFCYP